LQTERKCDTAAFVFLYRILERIYYTVPLLYVSTQSDYFGTFKDLKDILREDAVGELGLYRKFLEQGKFIDPVKLDITYKIDFSTAGSNAAGHYRVTDSKFKNFHLLDKANSQLEIKFRHVADLLSSLRNRFFHSRTGDGQGNIKIHEVHDTDEYFSYLNPIFCSYLATISLQTIALRVS
jgi:hypothetical protein